MGILLYGIKTGLSYDLGAGGFCNLRQKVAELCSPEFGEHYQTLTSPEALCVDLEHPERKEAFYEEFDRKTLELIKKKKVSVKVVDFCLQSDVCGKIGYGACKIILDKVKDYDDNICYGYCGRPDCFMFKDFKELLQACVDNKSYLVWE